MRSQEEVLAEGFAEYLKRTRSNLEQMEEMFPLESFNACEAIASRMIDDTLMMKAIFELRAKIYRMEQKAMREIREEGESNGE